jgi:hypothetical protein
MINNRARSTKSEMSLTFRQFNMREMEVSDTHKACRAGSPGHRAGNRIELSSSLRVVSSSRRDYGEQCFQFLFCRFKVER